MRPREGNIAPGDIAAIIVSRPGWTKLPGPLHPEDLINMAHSPAYFVAAGAHDKRFGWEHAGPEKIAERGIHAVIDKVRVGPQPPDATGYRQGATVTIETTDGRKVTNTVLIPKGAASLGVDWADIDEKYRALGAERAAVEGEDRGEPGGDQGTTVVKRRFGAGGAVGLAIRRLSRSISRSCVPRRRA